jgi:hypothetical protein
MDLEITIQLYLFHPSSVSCDIPLTLGWVARCMQSVIFFTYDTVHGANLAICMYVLKTDYTDKPSFAFRA